MAPGTSEKIAATARLLRFALTDEEEQVHWAASVLPGLPPSAELTAWRGHLLLQLLERILWLRLAGEHVIQRRSPHVPSSTRRLI